MSGGLYILYIYIWDKKLSEEIDIQLSALSRQSYLFHVEEKHESRLEEPSVVSQYTCGSLRQGNAKPVCITASWRRDRVMEEVKTVHTGELWEDIGYQACGKL